MNPGDKRALNAQCSEGKRPRGCVPSIVQLAELQKDQWLLIHGLEHIVESSLRPAVAEEIASAVSRVLGPVQEGFPLQQIAGSPPRDFQLQFKTNPAAKSFTGNALESEHGDTICVVLIDAATGQHVIKGPESLATLEVVPLVGDFSTSEKQEWSTEEFERHVAKEREGRGPLLVGDLKVCLRDGEGMLGQMYFTDNSSFTRSKKFRLGVRVAQDNECRLMSVREGKSQAFAVIDIRGKAYKKHDTPFPTDEVWRLLNIGKDGPYHKKLRQIGINTVKDFLSCLDTEPKVLKDVLGKMSEKAYQVTIEHAKKCILSDKLYVYPVEQSPYSTNYQVAGAVVQGHYLGLEMTDGVVEDLSEPPIIDDVEGNVTAAWTLQEQSTAGFHDLEIWSEDVRIHEQWDGDDEVASPVQYVVRQEYEEPFELFALDDPTPTVGKWWLRFRSVVRCALFIRRAGFAPSF